METEKRKEKKNKKKKSDKIEVSVKHKTLRIVCFVIVTVIAIVSFSIGISQWVKKEPGYYDIKASADDLVPGYANGITLTCYFDGKSDEIRVKNNNATTAYSNGLKWIYCMVDAETNYDGYNNIAMLNQHMGEDISVSSELFNILTDAYEFTCRGTGYNMFAGLLAQEWNSILYLDDPSEVDPLNDPYEAERLEKLAEATANLDNFSFEIVDEAKHTVCFNISQEYRQLIEDLELEGPVLDLNIMREAFILRYLTRTLNDAGVTTGFIATDSGLTCTLSESSEAAFLMYGRAEDGSVQYCASIASQPGAALCQFTSYAIDPEAGGYYELETEGGTLLRHPHFNLLTAEMNEFLLNASTVSYSGDIVEACLRCIEMYSCKDAESLRQLIAAIPDGDTNSSYILVAAPYIVNTSHSRASMLSSAEDTECVIEIEK